MIYISKQLKKIRYFRLKILSFPSYLKQTKKYFQMKNTLKIFEGTKVCWIGINSEEIIHMNEILISNGGAVTTLEDPNCTHVVSN